MGHPLGNWAAIDIETSGADPSSDSIIDIGYLQFEGTKLVRKYSSLVRYEYELSQFIQKLTGISSKMANKAPSWDEVEPEVMELYGHHLLAHNASFEEGFLKEHFDAIDDGQDREKYEDSIIYLSLLFPQLSSLKLERFIVDWNIADSEIHRGFEDSVDLLKVLLVATLYVVRDHGDWMHLDAQFKHYQLTNYWYYKFFCLKEEELLEIAEQLEFDVEAHLQFVDRGDEVEVSESYQKHFDLDFSGSNIKGIFSDKEKLSEIFPGFKYRPSQEELSIRVGQSFKNHVHSLVQAPTGTGKTLGYFIPASLFSLSEKKQVLVSTGTKALQEQIISKDVPKLRKILGLSEEEFKLKRLVGSSNHLCELLFRQQEKEEDTLFAENSFEKKVTEIYFERVFFHNSKVPYEKKILRDDLPFVFKRRFEDFRDKDKELAVDFRFCTGNKCPFKHDCSYLNGLREAKDANIIVGNHALMFNWPKGFPRPAHIVVDEAHKIEGEATRAFSYELDANTLESMMNNLSHLQGVGSLFYLLSQNEHTPGESTPKIQSIRDETLKTHSMLKDHVEVLSDYIERYFKKVCRNYTDKYWNELPMISNKGTNDTLGVSIYNHLDSIKNIMQMYYDFLLPHHLLWDVKQFNEDNEVIAFTRFESFMSSLEDIVAALDVSVNLKEGFSHSINYHEDFGYQINSSPIDIGKILHEGLLQTSASVVFTSATLGNASGNSGAKGIEWATGYSYLEGDRRFKSGFYLPATFDYRNNTKVFLCDDSPSLYDKSFVPSTMKEVVKLIRNLEGKSLLLFSARTRFEAAREILFKEFEGELPVFVQGMGSKVVEDFKKSEHGILLGMETFGEGIDIPGEKLQFIFIDKIPDLRRDLVTGDRQDFYEANIGNAFTDYYLSHRTRSLHQKLGRLLRTETDRGGIIIVDSRIRSWKGRTMEKLMQQMEPYKIERLPLGDACEQVEDFIRN